MPAQFTLGDLLSIVTAVAAVALMIGTLKATDRSRGVEIKSLQAGNSDKGRRLEEHSKSIAVIESEMSNLKEEVRRWRSLARFIPSLPNTEQRPRRKSQAFPAVPHPVDDDASSDDEHDDG
jgi:hypothetical protein